eukprot:CAMPEP_0117042720 /NCGR_PEP_ID=MMETSP0472-20121206/29736_1 /TAXON_ID=693140 ORGANISM="Tiarina fusus, Strain LIS" /NCGR_SAMPLE_ID=MMETSP0472 /ASSEMBLY_ACC=CAM_ASM_000603 /LENGTH=141 /DNA_ID=CAMNT_0004754043 /DNA_START=39 /DNA_END=461 /DNA_ORIENTATION=+
MPTLPTLEHQLSSLSTSEQPIEKDVVPVLVTPTNSASVSSEENDASFDDHSSTENSSTGADASEDNRMLVAKTEHKMMELKGMLDDEPLLMPNPHRFVIFPIQDNDLWGMYKKAEASFWTSEEIDLGSDMVDWDKLNDNER